VIKQDAFGFGQIFKGFGGNLSQIRITRRDFIGMYFSSFALERGLDLCVSSVLGYAQNVVISLQWPTSATFLEAGSRL